MSSITPSSIANSPLQFFDTPGRLREMKSSNSLGIQIPKKVGTGVFLEG